MSVSPKIDLSTCVPGQRLRDGRMATYRKRYPDAVCGHLIEIDGYREGDTTRTDDGRFLPDSSDTDGKAVVEILPLVDDIDDSSPPPVDPPRGWVKLEPGTIIQKNDLFADKSYPCSSWADCTVGYPLTQRSICYRHPARFPTGTNTQPTTQTTTPILNPPPRPPHQ